MTRTDELRVRIGPALHARLAQLRNERHVNVSAWTRTLLKDALDREFPPERGDDDQPETADPVGGWKPRKVGNDWAAVLEGHAVADLPDDLCGTAIAITDRKGESWTAAVTEVLERSGERIVVRHSGRPRA